MLFCRILQLLWLFAGVGISENVICNISHHNCMNYRALSLLYLINFVLSVAYCGYF